MLCWQRCANRAVVEPWAFDVLAVSGLVKARLTSKPWVILNSEIRATRIQRAKLPRTGHAATETQMDSVCQSFSSANRSVRLQIFQLYPMQ